jgi:hypothetical protein
VGELEKYKLDLVGVQEVRWEGEGYQTADNYTFLYGKEIKEDEVGGHVARMGEGRGVYRVLVGRPEGKRPLGRLRCREDNIKMDLRDIGIDGVNWIQLAQDRVQWRACVNTVMNLRVPYESRIFFDKLSDNQLYK